MNDFGGDWTTEKLKRVKKYLKAYSVIMNKQKFKFAYIDAFAGTGYRKIKEDITKNQLNLLDELQNEGKKYSEGSASIALQVEPQFSNYIFIEKDTKRFFELEKIKKKYPDLENKIQLINTDANTYIKERCLNYKWTNHRAVMFLDPYGMEVQWGTIEAIAKTKAIDMWLLFPLGVAINRLLKKNSEINQTWQKKLDDIFGDKKWRDVFYQENIKNSLFGDVTIKEKIANFDIIGKYFVERLKSIFPGVAENPMPLLNSKNNPLFLLCFASGNPKGASTAIKIAQEILKR